MTEWDLGGRADNEALRLLSTYLFLLRCSDWLMYSSLAGNLLKMEASKMGDSSNRFVYHGLRTYNQDRATLQVEQNRYIKGRTGTDKRVGIFMLLLFSDKPRISR